MGLSGVYAGPRYITGLPSSGDATAALQAAVDGAATGDILTLPPGTWRTDRLDIDKALTFQGAGYGSTFIVPTAQQDCIRLNVGQASQVSNIILRDFSILPLTDRSAGAALRLGYVGFVNVRNVRISNALGGRPFEGVRVGRASDSHFANVRTQGCVSSGALITPDSASSVIVEVYFDGECEFRSGQADGVYVLMDRAYSEGVCSVEGLHFVGCMAYNNAKAGYRVHATVASASPRNLHFKGASADSNSGTSITASAIDGGIVLDATDSGADIRRVEIDFGGGWSSFNGNVGVYANRVRDFVILGGQVRANNTHGLDIQNSHWGVIDSTLIDNSRAADNTSYGCQIGGASTNIAVASQFDNSDAAATDQRGLNLGSTATGIDWSKARFRNQEVGTVPSVNGGNAVGNTGLKTFPLGAGAMAAKTGAYTVEADVETVRCDTTGGAFTVTLPRAPNFPGRRITVKRAAGANTVTIAATAGSVETTSVTTATITHQSDGTNWLAI